VAHDSSQPGSAGSEYIAARHMPGRANGRLQFDNEHQSAPHHLPGESTDGQYLGPVDRFETGGTVSYNGLVISAQRRFSHVNLNGNYTWSHCIGDVTQASTVGGVNASPLDPGNRRLDRGNCQTPTLDGTQALDRRHNANFTAVLEAPRFSRGGLARALTSDWRLSTSYRVLSGAFQTVTLGVDRQLTGYGNQRPNQIAANPLCDDPNPGCWINRAAFDASVPYGTLGNLGRSNVRGRDFSRSIWLFREFSASRRRSRLSCAARRSTLPTATGPVRSRRT